jgi:hypothetical protein
MKINLILFLALYVNILWMVPQMWQNTIVDAVTLYSKWNEEDYGS